MKIGFVLVAVSVLACNPSSGSKPTSDTATIEQARAAIQSLERRDAEAVLACEADVQSCFDARADGGASGACEDLKEQCDEAKEALDDVRGPAVACWQRVEACARQGKHFAASDAGTAAASDAGTTCDVRPPDCEDAGEDADEDRNPILECRDAVRECISSLRSRSDDWRSECGELRSVCSNICGLAANARRDHGGMRQRVRGLIERLRERRHHRHGDGSVDAADAGSR